APAADGQRGDFLLAVSDIYVQKNLHNLFRAMRKVCDRYPHVELRIAGQPIDAWYYEKAIELAGELGIADNITFLGRLPLAELMPLYQRCRAFVFPSTAETFGMPLVEAMACGAPIASSSSTAMPEIVGDAALLFDPMDVDDMAAAILKLLDDGALRAALSERAVRRAADFSWRRTAEMTADVLVEASQRRIVG
ncbi:MAG: glycosyltransferase family 4 protein, partial [Magnetospirillum sp.]|nr:glycosyltransferase family 4 protein [Magnetospirillum sp.]